MNGTIRTNYVGLTYSSIESIPNHEISAFISATETQKLLKKKEIMHFGTHRKIYVLQAPVKHGNVSYISVKCKEFID
jgi:hypothetical protein